MSDQPDNGQRPAVSRNFWIGILWVVAFYVALAAIGGIVCWFIF